MEKKSERDNPKWQVTQIIDISSLSYVVALSFPGYLMLWEFKPFQTDCSPVKPRIRQPWKLSRSPILPALSLLPFSSHVL